MFMATLYFVTGSRAICAVNDNVDLQHDNPTYIHIQRLLIYSQYKKKTTYIATYSKVVDL